MIVYSNSCSFGAPNQKHQIYPEVVADHFSATTLINKGRPGSCNRRIVRSTLRDLIEVKNQKTLALVGLSFLSRSETWNTSLGPYDNDGDFNPIPINFRKYDWSQGILNSKNDTSNDAEGNLKTYYREWILHVHNVEGETTNLLADIIMLSAFAKQNDIKILIFNNTELLPSKDLVDYDSAFLKSFCDAIKNDLSIIDLWNFSFSAYALNLGHRPKDEDLFGINGHPNVNAHKDFGNYLIKYIEEKL